MKTIITLAIFCAMAGCNQRPDTAPIQPAPASAPDAAGQGAGGGGRR